MDPQAFQTAVEVLRNLYESDIFPDQQMLLEQLQANREARTNWWDHDYSFVLNQKTWEEICAACSPEFDPLI